MSAIFTLGVLSLSFAYAVFQNAGVTPDWNWSLCAIGVACALYFLSSRWTTVPRLDRWTAGLLAAFLAVAVFQIVPLPINLVHVLSPTRVELLRATERILGRAPALTTLSVVPSLTFQYVLTIAGCVLVFLVLRELSIRFRDVVNAWVPAWPLIIVAALEGGLGFYQAYTVGGEGFARGTYAGRDHYAGLLELVLPFAVLYPLAILQRDRNRFESRALPAVKACGVLLLATTMLVGIVLSLCRMAFLSTLASLFIAGTLALTLPRRSIDPTIKISGWRRLLPIALVGFVVILGFIFLPTDQLIGRFSEFAQTERISADTRAQIWRETVGLIKDFPLFGCGLGGYESAFLRYKTVAPMFTVDYAHNDYLQVLAEMGILGFGIGLLLLLRVMYSAVSGAIRADSTDDRCLSIACLGSLTAITLHSFVDFNMYVPANALAVCWISGIAATRLTSDRRLGLIETSSVVDVPAEAQVT